MVDYPQWVYGPQRGSSWTKSIFSLFLTAHSGTCAQRGCYFSLPLSPLFLPWQLSRRWRARTRRALVAQLGYEGDYEIAGPSRAR